jgi:hypothetical protein
MKILIAVPFVILGVTGCGAATLEEACEEYCAAAEQSACGEGVPAECGGGCSQLRTQLEQVGYGDCIEEYTDALDCAADGSFTCYEGFPVANGEGCTQEALDLSACIQAANPDEN